MSPPAPPLWFLKLGLVHSRCLLVECVSTKTPGRKKRLNVKERRIELSPGDLLLTSSSLSVPGRNAALAKSCLNVFPPCGLCIEKKQIDFNGNGLPDGPVYTTSRRRTT